MARTPAKYEREGDERKVFGNGRRAGGRIRARSSTQSGGYGGSVGGGEVLSVARARFSRAGDARRVSERGRARAAQAGLRRQAGGASVRASRALSWQVGGGGGGELGGVGGGGRRAEGGVKVPPSGNAFMGLSPPPSAFISNGPPFPASGHFHFG